VVEILQIPLASFVELHVILIIPLHCTLLKLSHEEVTVELSIAQIPDLIFTRLLIKVSDISNFRDMKPLRLWTLKHFWYYEKYEQFFSDISSEVDKSN
jgi:hypothetical protein